MADRGNFKDLFAPNMIYKYFDKAKDYKFKARSNKFELVNAAWCADASLLVYVKDVKFVQDNLGKAGLTGECEGFDKPGVQYFIAYNNDFALVSFRGTEVSEKEDLWADAEWNLTEAKEGKNVLIGKVHAGFQKTLDLVWDRLVERLKKLNGTQRTVWFTGHSLGAALATLAADRWTTTQGLYTFGCPRVGDQDFKNDFYVHAYRFVHQNDIVTRVPPPPLYSHIGNVYYIDSEDEIDDSPSTFNRLQDGFKSKFSHLIKTANHWRRGHWDTVALDDLADHSPTKYAQKIWKNVTSQNA